ncbi:MAG TPA: hypothetical protein VH083_15175, partial [Myxococcales bacterium]|nr:hypothetical protein [Myxococcales bacterium]
PRHALEVALLRAVHLAPSGSLPDLVARVEALSKGKPLPAAPAADAPRKAPAGWTARTVAPEGAPLRAEPKPEPAPPRVEAPPSAPKLDAAPSRFINPSQVPTPPPDPEEPRAEAAPVDLRTRFRQLIEAVKAARKPGAASALEHATPQKIDKTGVRIAFRKGDGRAVILADKDVRLSCEMAFEKILGFRAPLIVSEEETQAGESVAEQKQKQRAAASSSRIALAKEHPAVRAAVDLLGGEIEDVRDLGEE